MQRSVRVVLAIAAGICLTASWSAGAEPIDMQKAREIHARFLRGEKLTPEEQAYHDRAMEERHQQGRDKSNGRTARAGDDATKEGDGNEKDRSQGPKPTDSTGLIPLTELGTNRYKGEDGGLYGNGSNEVPAAHLAAVERELAKIQPLDREGRPSPDGRIVFTSLGMSNTTIEFSQFEEWAAQDPRKSPNVVVVDGAQGGRVSSEWAELPGSENKPWPIAFERLEAAGVTPLQVQAVWIKQAERRPQELGEFPAHARYLADNIAKVLQRVHEHYPNCRVAYLSSRIYGGYAKTTQNPEPYAYESAFANRWVILDQMQGKPELNFDPAKGPVMVPAVVWGPYLWADGVKPRAGDGLVWLREDFRQSDGTHPSGPGGAAIEEARHQPNGRDGVAPGRDGDSGRRKVANLLMQFVRDNPLANRWYVGK